MLKTFLYFSLLLLISGCTFEDVSSTQQQNETLNLPTPKVTENTVPMLDILVSFKNQTISSTDEIWSQKFFGEQEGELNHYYIETSVAAFKYTQVREESNIVNDGIISISLDQNHPSIDVDNYYFEQKVYPLLSQALMKVDEFVDFSNYDKDANGFITPNELTLVFIMAGYEDAYEGRHIINGIWGHQNCMEDENNVVLLDGVSMMGCEGKGNFAVFGEKHNRVEPYDATIGIIAHELGHATFDLPDLYNTTNPNSGGIGFFGIMGSGTWGVKNDQEAAGTTPTHFTAWSKIYNGWIEPIEQKGDSSLYETSSDLYNIIKIPINATSYYLLENRNNSGYDRGLYSLEGSFKGGIAIWKVDNTKLTQEYIENNNVNGDTAHKGIDLVEAQSSLIDVQGDGGAENALYYSENKSSFLSLVSNISSRGDVMHLNINY